MQVLPIFQMRAARIIAQIGRFEPGVVRSVGADAGPRHRGVTDIGEFVMVAQTAMGTGDPDHLQCCPGNGPAPLSSSRCPLSKRDRVIARIQREYAAGLHQYEIGLPKGRLEKGESVLAGAQREMKEEIGFGAKRLEILTTLSLAPGYMTHITHIVLARDLYPEKLEGDEPEELEVIPWPIADLRTLTAREDCTEGRSIAALYIARDFMGAEKT